MPELVEPDDRVPAAEILRTELLYQGVTPQDADVLSEWALGPAGSRWWPNGRAGGPLPVEARLDSFVRTAGRELGGAESRSRGHALLLRELVLRGVAVDDEGEVVRGDHESRDVPAAQLIAQLAGELGVGLESLVAKARKPDDPWWRFALALAANPESFDDLRPESLLDLDRLRAWDPTANRSSGSITAADCLAFWFRARGARALEDMVRVVALQPAESAGRVALAVLRELRHPLGHHAGTDLLDERSARNALNTLVDVLREDIDETGFQNAYVLAAYFGTRHMLVEFLDPHQSDTDPDVVHVADKSLGLLRRSARDGLELAPGADQHVFAVANRHALGALARGKGLGAMLVSGTQLLRSLRDPCVTPDLRWWGEEGHPLPPRQWHWLPEAMSSFVHLRGRVEEKSDPLLVDARTVLARHLISRLKPRRGGDGEPTEPSPMWRRCCIRAARELGVNPDGRGHQVLHHVQAQDPDEAVRRDAHRAQHELRRADADDDAKSPRRRLITALWWLRQAHLLDLGIEIDEAGARRTRQREISVATNPNR